MSIRHALLAVLANEAVGAFQLRQQFERRTGGTWPLNMGQVSTTLDRLVRDGLVEPSGLEGDIQLYMLTPGGREQLSAWWQSPVDRAAPGRDELAIKLALAVTAQGVDVQRLVQAQRSETLRAMQALTRLKTDDFDAGAAPDDLAWSLVLDNLIFAAEAEIRWLDHVETRVVVASASQGTRVAVEHQSGVRAGGGK